MTEKILLGRRKIAAKTFQEGWKPLSKLNIQTLFGLKHIEIFLGWITQSSLPVECVTKQIELFRKNYMANLAVILDPNSRKNKTK